MNIKISKEEHDYLMRHKVNWFIIGSHLYGTNTEESDGDVLCIYDDSEMMGFAPISCDCLPNYHQFQYDCKEENQQYIWTTWEQFYRNLFSGDSTINADVAMFHSGVIKDPLRVCRTYKVIKAYLGFAKRDIKDIDKGKNKLFHAKRGLYCAHELLENRLPTIEGIQSVSKNYDSVGFLTIYQNSLRDLCNTMYNNGELEMYYIPTLPKSLHPWNTLLVKLLNSNNTKEFKYD